MKKILWKRITLLFKNRRIGDFVCNFTAVVLGIILTFMGSDWIEKRNTQRDVKSALHLVKAELQTNRETILGGKQRVEREIRAAQFLLRNKDSLLVVSKDSLEYYSNMPFQTSFITFTTDALELMKSSALFPQIKDRQLGLSVPNSAGEMVPFSSFTKVEEQLWQDQINRYNMYSTAALTCNVAPGSSTGQAIQEMEALFKEQLGDEFGYEWTSVAYQETQAGNTTTIVLVMALIVAFLVLAAQYESWTSPVAAVIGLPVALLGAMIGCLIMGTPVSIYTQIGIILLIALSAKNGILIVEFARDFRAEGNSIRDAAFEAGHVRLRPILMTSFAFVLGVMPLLFATGAGAESRIALGAAVVFGMAMNTLLATVYVPNFYELMQKLQEKFGGKKKVAG